MNLIDQILRTAIIAPSPNSQLNTKWCVFTDRFLSENEINEILSYNENGCTIDLASKDEILRYLQCPTHLSPSSNDGILYESAILDDRDSLLTCTSHLSLNGIYSGTGIRGFRRRGTFYLKNSDLLEITRYSDSIDFLFLSRSESYRSLLSPRFNAIFKIIYNDLVTSENNSNSDSDSDSDLDSVEELEILTREAQEIFNESNENSNEYFEEFEEYPEVDSDGDEGVEMPTSDTENNSAIPSGIITTPEYEFVRVTGPESEINAEVNSESHNSEQIPETSTNTELTEEDMKALNDLVN